MNKEGGAVIKGDNAGLRSQVEQLRKEAALPRKKVSECVKELMEFCEQNKPNDHLVSGPAAGAENPFQDKKKCNML